MTDEQMHFVAPGRVNIIGEHTDYNGGYVLPATIDKYTQVSIGHGQKNSVRVHSEEEGFCEFNTASFARSGDWCDYVRGIFWVLKEQKGVSFPGLDLTVVSSVPQGSGLSSSAALEVAVLVALDEFLQLGLKKEEKYLLARKAENEFVGVMCGIMDQFAAVMGKEKCAVFLDTQTMDYEYVPLDLGNYVFMVVDSKVHHSLSSGMYNKRREEAAAALKELGKSSYRETTITQLLMSRKSLRPENYRRAMHIISENERVLDAVRSLRSSNYENLGRFLLQSHESLAYDYEVSCEELDYIVDLLKGQPSVTGCRMIGGGFGGSVLAICEKDEAKPVTEYVKTRYFEKYEMSAEVFLAKPGGGARRVEKPLLKIRRGLP